MATRIAFSTVYPDRMKELAGKPTRFPEKIVKGLGLFTNRDEDFWAFINYMEKMGCFLSFEAHKLLPPKTTTIRSNYEYWKSKEGQLLQPFFWAGKPYRSKHVVFCPEVRLKRVSRVCVFHNDTSFDPPIRTLCVNSDESLTINEDGSDEFNLFTQNEGFDHPDHFWMWFDQDFCGALLEFKAVEG